MMKSYAPLILASGLALSMSAFASHDVLEWNEGWYIGAGINGNAESTMNYQGSPEVFSGTLSGISEVELSENNVGVDVYVGRKINKHWSTELGYTYVGQSEFDVETSETKVGHVEVNQWNLHLVGIGTLPIGHYVNAFVKGGVAYLSTEQEFDLAGLSDNTDTLHSFAVTYGAGLEVTWANWGVRGEYNVIWPGSNVQDDFYVADIISANVYYKFNV